jgi:hypothetical protein
VIASTLAGPLVSPLLKEQNRLVYPARTSEPGAQLVHYIDGSSHAFDNSREKLMHPIEKNL